MRSMSAPLLAHRTRREAPVRDPAHGPVPRRIEHDDHLRRRHHGTGRRSVIPCALEKRSGCFEISKMSACFVIAQNGS